MRKIILSLFILLSGLVAVSQADDEALKLVPITADNAEYVQLLGLLEHEVDNTLDWKSDGRISVIQGDFDGQLLDAIQQIITPEESDPFEEKFYQSVPSMRSDNFFSGYQFSPDGSRAIIVEREIMEASNFLIQIWDVEQNILINTFQNWMFDFKGMVTWSPDSRFLAIGLARSNAAGNHERVLSIIDVEAEHESAGYGQNYFDVGIWFNNDQAKSYQHVRMAWNSDGSLLAVVLADQLLIYSITDDETPLMSITIPDLVDLKWGDEDRLLIGTDIDGVIHVWGVVGEGINDDD